jgi:hypothetical protein
MLSYYLAFSTASGRQIPGKQGRLGHQHFLSQPFHLKFPIILSFDIIQGDQKVSVHLITIQKVTSNAQSVPCHSPDIYCNAELCSRRPCSVQHGPHSECILWWPSSTHQLCGDCSTTLSFSSQPREKKPGGERSGDLGGQIVLEIILSANKSSKSAIDICPVWSAESRPCQFHLLSIAQWRDTQYCHSTVGSWQPPRKLFKILYFCVFLYCNRQVHRDFLITRYKLRRRRS